ncbi:MAG: hypothetical protein NZL89_01380, partial [Leptospiraceae bacterium]|nr:hypothetical protein [Leptospiraceae bacterium]
AEEKARSALRTAFSERRQLEDVNEYLKLGTLYLMLEVAALPLRNERLLREGARLLGAMRTFEKDLGNFRQDLTPPKSVSFRLRHSRFSAQYHLQYGILLRRLGFALREYSPEALTKILDDSERDMLYAPIEVQVARERRLVLPRKYWDRAFTDGAITHFEIALKKDRHSEAAFELVDLCERLWENADANRRKELQNLVARYAPLYLETAHEESRMARVRSVLKRLSHA